ncbi:MAG: GTPase HflX [bacterium]
MTDSSGGREGSSRVLLAGLAASNRERWIRAGSLDELAALAATAGAEVVEKLVQVRNSVDPALYFGSGFADRLGAMCREAAVGLVVVDEPLTPTQQRNLEEAVGVRVIDRSALILDIFAIHARTAEARLQVELAQLEYRQSRLVGMRDELSRLGGGIGTRGPGETRLEVDRRRIKQRITALRRGLEKVDRERAVQRRARSRLPRVALVGYTNAGKSTLFNRLTESRVLVSDRLFATLDANTRPWQLAEHLRVVLTDTVGFIRHLPHELVASFRATLAEVREASLLLHLADVTDTKLDGTLDAVRDTLEQVGAGSVPVRLVFSKCDRLFDDAARDRLDRLYPGSVFLSAQSGEGIEDLRQALVGHFEAGMVACRFSLPVGRQDLVHHARVAGRVVREVQAGGRIRLTVLGFPEDIGRARGLLAGLPDVRVSAARSG